MGIWFDNLVDKKFAGAKTTFQDSASTCLQAATFEEDCESEQNKKLMDDCWKPAEKAAGGEWKTDAQGVVSQCPYGWFFESVKASQPEHSAWFEKQCRWGQSEARCIMSGTLAIQRATVSCL